LVGDCLPTEGKSGSKLHALQTLVRFSVTPGTDRASLRRYSSENISFTDTSVKGPVNGSTVLTYSSPRKWVSSNNRQSSVYL
jgi:hypothetical protein